MPLFSSLDKISAVMDPSCSTLQTGKPSNPNQETRRTKKFFRFSTEVIKKAQSIFFKSQKKFQARQKLEHFYFEWKKNYRGLLKKWKKMEGLKTKNESMHKISCSEASKNHPPTDRTKLTIFGVFFHLVPRQLKKIEGFYVDAPNQRFAPRRLLRCVRTRCRSPWKKNITTGQLNFGALIFC